MASPNTSRLENNGSFSDCELLFDPSITGPSVALLFKEVATPLILFFGVVGNVMSIILMNSRILRRKSYSQYLCALALFDSLTLIGRQVRVVEELMAALGHPSLFHGFTEGMCKMYSFMQSVSVSMSSWVMVLMAFERFVVIFFPFRRHLIYTSGRSLGAIIVTFFLVCLSQIYTIVMMGYDEERGLCSAKPEHNFMYVKLYTYFHVLCMIIILPMLSIICCNVAVVLKISQYKRIREKSQMSQKSKSSISHQRIKTTAMLVTISSVYVVTLLPSVLSMFVIQSTIIDSMNSTGPNEGVCGKLLAFVPYGHLLEVISALNYGVNFYIYVLSGKAFRFELKKILRRESHSSSTRVRHDLI